MASTSVDILLRVRDEATAKLREVATETGGIVGTMQRLSAGLGVWGGLAAGISTVAVAAVAASSKLSDMVEQLDRASAITSVGFEPLQAMFKIVRDAGGDTESLTKALGRFKREVAESNPILKQLEITSGTVEERFLKLVGILGRSSDEAKVSKITFELLGKTGEQLIPHFDDLANKTRDVEEAMKKSGEAISGKLAPSLRKLDQEVDTLRGTWRGSWNDVVGAFTGPSRLFVRLLDATSTAVRQFGRSMHETTFGVLEDLARAEEATETYADRWRKAQAEARRTGGHIQVGVPMVAGITVVAPPDPLAGIKSPEKKGKSVSRPMFGPGNAAGISEFIQEQLRAATEAQGEFLKRNLILPQMFGGGILPLPGGPGRIAGSMAKEDPFKKILSDWNKAVDGITNSVSVLKESLGSVWAGLRDGISSVFSNMLGSSQTFAQAIRSVFLSLGQSILSYLGELVAAKVFQLFLKLVAVALKIPIPGAALTAVSGTSMSGVSLTTPGGGGAPLAAMASAGGRGGNTYILQTISMKDALQSLVSPTGVLRSANDRLIEVAAAS